MGLQNFLQSLPVVRWLQNRFLPEKSITPVNWPGSVIVIGAGAAGLYAAYLLKQRGIQVTLLEATDRIGGRIKTLEGFANIPIELGAEFVNGSNHVLHHLATQSGIQLSPVADGKRSIYFWLHDRLVSEAEAERSADVQQAYRMIGDLAHYRGDDMSFADYLNTLELSPEVLRLTRLLGIESGASNEQISVTTLSQVMTDGFQLEKDHAFKAQVPFLDILHAITQHIENDIHYQCPVDHIDTRGAQITVSSPTQTFTADKVIVTVPLPVLQQKLSFHPHLPAVKRQAIRNLKMGPGMKVILKFKSRFWPTDLRTIAGGEFATYWPSERAYILTAFAVGEHAARLMNAGSTAIQCLLSELDSFFGDQRPTENFMDSYTMNWTDEPFIGGYVTYPSSSSYLAEKAALAAPLDNRVFFAGEATNTDPHSMGYVHGALLTGERAVSELLATLSS
jgi:monoamine oxidase